MSYRAKCQGKRIHREAMRAKRWPRKLRHEAEANRRARMRIHDPIALLMFDEFHGAMSMWRRSLEIQMWRPHAP